MAMEDFADAPLDELRTRLADAEETLRAIRAGEVDAVIVQGDAGEQVYTLRSVDQTYRDLVEQMREGAAILTTDGDILYCNRRFAELVHLPLERVIGGSITRFLAPDDRASFDRLSTGESATRRGRLFTHAGGHVEVYLSATVTVTEGVARVNLIVADLSELLDVKAERDRAERANREKDEFIAMLAHELRNPIGAIAGAAQVLDSAGSAAAPAVRARGVITRQVQHLARLIEDLLDVGRLTTGKIVLARQPLDLGDLVRRSVATLGGDGRIDRRIEVNTAPVWIDADPTRIEQIVGNLVGNAIKYTAGGGSIRVTVSADGRDALLSVADDGFGIATDLLPRIFELFVQGDQTLDRSRGGLGIGLTLVRQLVELHGGAVSASSDGAGRGSVFTVRLPSVPAPKADHVEAATRDDVVRRRVLVVEDNRDSREMYCAALALAGHEVLEAGDAMRGLELLRTERPDIALIDIGLPGVDGYELARQCRADPQTNGVILVALTGYGSAADREQSRRAGFHHHMIKPVSADMLRDLFRASPTDNASDA